jgi:casein kinase 1
MKLHNGKGWEAVKQHPAVAHLTHGVLNTSQREIHGRPVKTPIPHDRLNADLPKPGATRPPVGSGRHPPQRRSESGAYTPDPVGQKRQSTQDFRHPEGSTVAQFQHSQQNLQPRNSAVQQQQQIQTALQQTQAARVTPEEQKVGAWQKIMKVLCCGM